jgi:SAM-dependent methyltransferase
VSDGVRAPSRELPDVRGEVIARYISSSPGIHRACDARERQAFVRAYRWHLRGWLPENQRRPWLDLGCGQGQLMSLAIESGFGDVAGVDLSAEMLSTCRDLGLSVTCEDATGLVHRLPDGAYGVVSAFDFVEHLPRNQALELLREARRVLAPGGVMLIKVPNGASPSVGDMFASDLTHEMLLTPSSIAQLGTLAGFSRCDVREVGPVPHGFRSGLRFVLWKGVRAWYRLLNAIETGSPGSDVLTRVMLVRLSV